MQLVLDRFQIIQILSLLGVQEDQVEGARKLRENLLRVSLDDLDLVLYLCTFDVLLGYAGVFRVLLDSCDFCFSRAVLSNEDSRIPIEGAYFEDLPRLKLRNNLRDYASLNRADRWDEGAFAHLFDLAQDRLGGVCGLFRHLHRE